MSFILDALKKSETDRQRQNGPALFEVRVAPPRTRLPLWAMGLAALLAVNLLIVGWVLLRRPAAAEAATGTPAAAGQTAGGGSGGSYPGAEPWAGRGGTRAGWTGCAAPGPAQYAGGPRVEPAVSWRGPLGRTSPILARPAGRLRRTRVRARLPASARQQAHKGPSRVKAWLRGRPPSRWRERLPRRLWDRRPG